MLGQRETCERGNRDRMMELLKIVTMPTKVVCSRETVLQLRVYAKQLHTLTEQYQELIDSHVVEFFVKKQWEMFPKSWQAALDGLPPDNLANLLLDQEMQQQQTVWPLSLLAYRAATRALALDPTPTVGDSISIKMDPALKPINLLCRLHVKKKKKHEILRMAEVINSASSLAGTERVVDVGSGHGHLSRLLSFGYGLKVTSIEAVGCHLTGAAKVDKKIKTIIRKRVSHQRTLTFRFGDEGVDFFFGYLNHYLQFLHNMEKIYEVNRSLIFSPISLTIIMYFSASDRNPYLNLHGYRATLEVVIQGFDREMTQCHSGICRIKKAVASVRKPHLKTFQEYAASALEALGIPYEDRHLADLEERYRPEWTNVITYHVLRIMMGPIVESLLLLDRVLYLYEQGIESKLVPVFDADISPRNFVLVAVKDS
eukprot:XP_011663098.1 PREDICTED: protein RRNAD1 [Strongylocentrotus purpuratus]